MNPVACTFRRAVGRAASVSQRSTTVHCRQLLGGHQVSAFSTERTPVEPAFTPGGPFPPKIEKLAQEVTSLTMIEMTMFLQASAKYMGIPWESFMNASAAPVMAAPSAAPAAAGPAASAAKKEEPKKEAKTTFTVKMIKMDEAKKYQVLKEIRALKPGMNLAESKKYIENLPVVLQEEATKEQGDKFIAALAKEGATVVLE
eukprot:TRINITY_DN5801_c0_g1_i1.p2 TRINITY_DN5801_c0_g1~~TRINITY_DN5801_c0_g1_i1.p2  ORF type:complete len:201 (+),score=30.52 TRINITY_DN5801_c0_g1_i1:70-672(+)